MTGAVFLWVIVCLNADCTDSQIWIHKPYYGPRVIARKQCAEDRKGAKLLFDPKYKGAYYLECKTQQQVDKEGFDYAAKIERESKAKEKLTKQNTKGKEL